MQSILSFSMANDELSPVIQPPACKRLRLVSLSGDQERRRQRLEAPKTTPGGPSRTAPVAEGFPICKGRARTILSLPDSVVESIFTLLDEAEAVLKKSERQFPPLARCGSSSWNLASCCSRFLRMYRATYITQLHLDLNCASLHFESALLRYCNVSSVHMFAFAPSACDSFNPIEIPSQLVTAPDLKAGRRVKSLVYDCRAVIDETFDPTTGVFRIPQKTFVNCLHVFPNLTYLYCGGTIEEAAVLLRAFSLVRPMCLESLSVANCDELWKQLPKLTQLRELILANHTRPLRLSESRALSACPKLERVFVHSCENLCVFESLPRTVLEVFILSNVIGSDDLVESERGQSVQARFDYIAGFAIPSDCRILAVADMSPFEMAGILKIGYGLNYAHSFCIRRPKM